MDNKVLTYSTIYIDFMTFYIWPISPNGTQDIMEYNRINRPIVSAGGDNGTMRNHNGHNGTADINETHLA